MIGAKSLLSVGITQLVSCLLVLHWGCLSFYEVFNVLFETGNSYVTLTVSILYGFFNLLHR